VNSARTLQKFIQHHSVEKSGVFVSSQFIKQQVQMMDFSLIPVGEIENPITGGRFQGEITRSSQVEKTF